MSNTTTFVLLKGSPTSWSVKQNGLMIEKKGVGLKFAAYYPGQDSIFVEDIKNKDLKPQLIPAFEFNPSTNKTELTVPNTDVNLITLLKLHPHYGKKFEIFSEEIESERALSKYNNIEKALKLIESANDLEVRAKGVVVLGVDAMHYLPTVAIAKLKELAFSNPTQVISKIEGMDYESQFIAAKAFIDKIVKTNLGHTAVVWSDTENLILTLGTGEIGVEKLARLLSQNNEQSYNMLQIISQKLGIGTQQEEQTPSVPVNTVSEKELQAKDDEIAKLRAELEAANKGSVHEINTPSTQAEATNKVEMTLEEATAKYIEKFNKEPGPTVKGDLEWILKKLKE
ncbi:hypothetical protein [Myroides odoratus]|uniref:Uncharacterized protein n=1 Tax=Myroides odoratus TaxID=256 RepID=A0A378RRM5_MYROD|nr:hypothetical protein [Myroides odoratus]QQU04235.1 hypothetical protein I6I89_02825 [Myroides odoratus]STZ28350.1 Uncharacterised protein [Myroides odoratus]